MKPANPRILTINGGSSSIKFALFEAGEGVTRMIGGAIERIGLPEAVLRVKGLKPADNFSKPVTAADHTAAVGALMDWLEQIGDGAALTAVGHRVVHGGPKYWEPQRITPHMTEELRRLIPFDRHHLPQEIMMVEAFRRRYPDVAQVACFDTAFHHDMPRVARQLPIPRRYEKLGVRRYGFHGLSYAFLMGELARLAGAEARGRVILAHLGNGASLAAVHDGKPVDTSMGFTPASGLPMGTRCGDLDPGLVSYLARAGRPLDRIAGRAGTAFSSQHSITGGLFSILGARGIEKQLRRVAGVGHVSVNPVSGSTTVMFDPRKTSQSTIQDAIKACGYHCAGESVPRHLCR